MSPPAVVPPDHESSTAGHFGPSLDSPKPSVAPDRGIDLDRPGVDAPVQVEDRSRTAARRAIRPRPSSGRRGGNRPRAGRGRAAAWMSSRRAGTSRIGICRSPAVAGAAIAQKARSLGSRTSSKVKGSPASSRWRSAWGGSSGIGDGRRRHGGIPDANSRCQMPDARCMQMTDARTVYFDAKGTPKSPSMFRHTEWMWLALFWVLLNSMRKVGPWTR